MRFLMHSFKQITKAKHYSVNIILLTYSTATLTPITGCDKPCDSDMLELNYMGTCWSRKLFEREDVYVVNHNLYFKTTFPFLKDDIFSKYMIQKTILQLVTRKPASIKMEHKKQYKIVSRAIQYSTFFCIKCENL